MTVCIQVSVSEAPLSVEDALRFVQSDHHGAMAIFVGTVRDSNVGRTVTHIAYDVFVPLAESTFKTIGQLAQARYTSTLKVYISHFKGSLSVGGMSVIIAVSSKHREESFAACRFIIEEIKKRAPIWKQEHYTDGVSEWVQGHALCQHAHHEC